MSTTNQEQATQLPLKIPELISEPDTSINPLIEEIDKIINLTDLNETNEARLLNLVKALVKYLNLILTITTNAENSTAVLATVEQLCSCLIHPRLMDALIKLDYEKYKEVRGLLLKLEVKLIKTIRNILESFNTSVEVVQLLTDAEKIQALVQNTDDAADQILNPKIILFTLEHQYPSLFTEKNFNPNNPRFQHAITLAQSLWYLGDLLSNTVHPDSQKRSGKDQKTSELSIDPNFQKISELIDTYIKLSLQKLIEVDELSDQEIQYLFSTLVILRHYLEHFNNQISAEQKAKIERLLENQQVITIFQQRSPDDEAESPEAFFEATRQAKALLTEARQILIELNCPFDIPEIITYASHVNGKKINQETKGKEVVRLQAKDFIVAAILLTQRIELFVPDSLKASRIVEALQLIEQAYNLSKDFDFKITYWDYNAKGRLSKKK